MSDIYGKDGITRYKLRNFEQPEGTSWRPRQPAVGWPRGIPSAKKPDDKKDEAKPADGGNDNNKWNPPNDAGDVFF